MNRIRRLLTILTVFAKYRLDDLLPDHPMAKPVHWIIRLIPAPRKHFEQYEAWARFRMAMEELGPVFIKFGQLLSTRRDLLPDDAIEELVKLQDQVPPFDETQSVAIIERELKKPVGELFASFEQTPLASASVAQVHCAKLHSGEEVVIKVIRPGIKAIVQRDMALLRTFASWLQKAITETGRFHPVQVVDDYNHIIMGELDLGQEAANAAQFRRNAESSDLLYVPEIHWKYCTSEVMVMERVYGVPISDIEAIKAAGIDLQTMAEVGVEIFFTQVFRDNFFHADMHPGNVLVSLKNPEQPQYLSLDCAIAGSLSRQERFLLARQLMALLDKDYEQIALLLVEAGWVPKHTAIQAFANALRTVLEPVLEKPLNDIEFGPILVRLFQTARRFEMQALPQFVLLEKTLIHVEGLGRQLYPELDIWTVGRPLLEEWIRDQVGPSALMQTLKRNAPALIEQVPHIPKLAWDALNEVKRLGENQEQLLAKLQQQQHNALRADRAVSTLGFSAIAVALLWGVNPEWVPHLSNIPWQAWGLGVAGAVLLLSRRLK